MKRLLRIVLFLLCPIILNAQVELHPIYTSPHMGTGAKFSEDGSKIVTWGGFGFSVWDVKTGKVLYTVTGHDERVNYAEFNHKGTAIVTASDDNTAKIWNAQNGVLLHALNRHKYWVCNAKFNVTDDRIITNSEDGNALLWNADNGNLITNLNGNSDDYVKTAHFNEGGDKAVVINSHRVITIYEIINGKQLHEYSTKKGWLSDAVFNDTGEYVYAVKNDSLVRLVLVNDFVKSNYLKESDTTVTRKGKFYGCCRCGPSHKYCKRININIQSKNNYIVKLSDFGKIQVYDLTTFNKIFEEKDTISGYKSAYFNSAGTYLIYVNGMGVATVMSTRTWKKVLQIGEENCYIESIIPDNNGNRVVVVGENGVTKIYNLKTGDVERELRQETNVKDENFDDIHYCIVERTKPGKVAAVSRITGYRLVEFTIETTLPKWIQYYPKVSRYVFCFDSSVEIRNPVTGNIITTMSNLPERYYISGFSESGDVLVIGMNGGYELRSAFTGKKLFATKYGDDCYPFVTRLSTDIRLTYSDKRYNALSVINVKNDRLISVLEGHTGWINSGIFAKSGNYVVTGSYDSTARVWNVKSGKTITIIRGHKGTVSAHFDSEANRVITASEDGTSKVWNAFTGELIATLTEHKAGVYDARFSNDDQLIITQSHDGVTRIYDANQLPYSFTDIPEEEKQMDITLSPNPAQNEIRICFSEPLKEKGEYAILSPTGVQITKGEVPAQSNGLTYTIDNTLCTGTYICLLRINGEDREEKFVVMR